MAKTETCGTIAFSNARSRDPKPSQNRLFGVTDSYATQDRNEGTAWIPDRSTERPRQAAGLTTRFMRRQIDGLEFLRKRERSTGSTGFGSTTPTMATNVSSVDVRSVVSGYGCGTYVGLSSYVRTSGRRAPRRPPSKGWKSECSRQSATDTSYSRCCSVGLAKGRKKVLLWTRRR